MVASLTVDASPVASRRFASATFKKISGSEYELANYSLQSVTEGMDALGEVTVKLERGKHSVTGRGLSTDIIEASILAYIDAINKILR